ncbi:MAG: penicillin-binding protein 2, partial [Blautia sp.]|nr:penicillin-binding protein 2 [Blautia sp.]
MRDREESLRKEQAKKKKCTEDENRKRKRATNKEYTLVTVFFVLIFLSLIGYLIYFNTVKSEDFINSPYNSRQDTFSDRVIRGDITSSEGDILATTTVYEDGSEQRYYPYENMFAHVVGYDAHGKSGLESEANFQLLSSHSYFPEQIKNQLY